MVLQWSASESISSSLRFVAARVIFEGGDFAEPVLSSGLVDSGARAVGDLDGALTLAHDPSQVTWRPRTACASGRSATGLSRLR